jgi:hypothetical protein
MDNGAVKKSLHLYKARQEQVVARRNLEERLTTEGDTKWAHHKGGKE